MEASNPFVVVLPLGWSRGHARMDRINDRIRSTLSRYDPNKNWQVVAVKRNYQKDVYPYGPLSPVDVDPIVTPDIHIAACTEKLAQYGSVVVVGHDDARLPQFLVNRDNGYITTEGVRRYLLANPVETPFVVLHAKQPRKVVFYSGTQMQAVIERRGEDYALYLFSHSFLLEPLDPVEILFNDLARLSLPERTLTFIDVTDYTPVILVNPLETN